MGYFDGVGQTFKTLWLWLCSLWFQVYIWNKLKLQCYWRLLTHLVPRGLVLQIISSSVDCFFNKNYFENNHSNSTAWFCGHLLERHSRYLEKVCLWHLPALWFSFWVKNHGTSPLMTLSHPLWICLLLRVDSVHCLKSVCKPAVFSLIKLHLSLCRQIVFFESKFLENSGNCLLRSFFLSLNKALPLVYQL